MPIQPDMAEHIPIPGDILLLTEHFNMPVQSSDIKSWTSTDPVHSTVCRYVMHGLPITVSDKNLFFKQRRDDLSVEDGWIYSVGIKDCCLSARS